MLTNFELKQLKPKLDIVKKPENRVHELTDSNVSRLDMHGGAAAAAAAAQRPAQLLIKATAYHRRLADKISKKTKEEYASVMNHMRTRIRFSIMRSVLVALRGQRGKPTTSAKPLAVTSFDLIPQSMAYESY